jgi:hypothetical protein
VNRSVLFAVLAVFVAVGLLGSEACTPAKTKAPEKTSAEQPYDLEQEGEIPPAPVEEAPAEADVEEIPVEDNDVVAENVEIPRDTTKSGETGAGPAGVEGRDGSVSVPVFRVQILATSSEQSALDAKKRVENRLGLAAYISLVDGMYKVRVGDCATREEANKVRETCRGAGYTDAWIVTDVLKAP